MDAELQGKCLSLNARIAVLFFRLGPYHYARLKAASGALRIVAVEFSDIDPTYAWDPVHGKEGFERVLLFPGDSVELQTTRHIIDTMDGTLSGLCPSAVAISGWHDRCSIIALKWCMLHGVPVILMSETTAWDDKRQAWREFVKKRVVRLCSAGLVGGASHTDYLAQLGMDRDRVFSGYDAVDNDYFADKAEESRKQKAENKKRHGLPENYFLASARFVEKKNLSRLLEAYARYRELSGKSQSGKQKATIWDLVLLGDGPLRPHLCQLISDLGLQNCVLLPGFKQYNDLPVYYALANAFVHASTTEQWGLVVNEAMASGLPVLVSNRCGCATDLVQDGKNGFTFDPRNVEEMAQLMLKISIFDFPLSAFGAASARLIAAWGPARFAKGLKQAVECALRIGPIKPIFLQKILLKSLLSR